MKAYIGTYPHKWSVRDIEHSWYWKRHGTWETEPQDLLDRAVSLALNLWDKTVNRAVNAVWGNRERIIKIHLDRWDTWNADHTIAIITLPLLIQLKEKGHGAGAVDNADVPQELHGSMDEFGNTDSHWEDRWNWLLDELIWTFTQLAGNGENFFHHLPEDAKVPEDWFWVKGLGITEGFWVDVPSEDLYHARIDNGLRLFGKYFRALWD